MNDTIHPPLIAWFATKGTGTNEALRLETLLGDLPNSVALPFDKENKRKSFSHLFAKIGEIKPSLIVMEGTGLAGGLACILARIIWGIPYVVSSGDAVGPFMRAHFPVLGIGFEVYERALCFFAHGFIGWTPYLTGRAMAFGTRHAMTAPGWVIGGAQPVEARPARRSEMRRRWGISESMLVVGIVGSLEWNANRKWCYGLDLVEAMCRVERKDLAVVIVGGGSGLAELKARAGERLGKNIFITGPVELAEVSAALCAFDVASLPQSLDGVGSYRYTTKLPEYAEAGLPVVTNRIPVAYDLGDEWMWRLPGFGPWEESHLGALSHWLGAVTPLEIDQKRKGIPPLSEMFDRESQVKRVGHFIRDLLDLQT